MFYKNDDVELVFNTDRSLFSPDAADKGTLAMLSKIHCKQEDKVLDLGCGYGFVGIYLIKSAGIREITFSDNKETAIRLTRENLILNQIAEGKLILSDGFENIIDKDFTLILSNPPYHADFSVPKHFIEKGFHHLSRGGRMVMVTKRKEWYKQKFIAVFGGVRIQEQEGYFIFEGEKRSDEEKRRKK